MDRPHRLRPLQLLAAAAASAALVAGGLVLTGGAARARSWLPTARPSVAALLEPVPGSEVRWERVLLDGRPTQVRVCRAPGWTAARLLDRYEALAAEQSPRGAPYVVQEGPAGGAVLWVGADGRSRAALVEAADDVRYRLVVDEAPGPARPGAGPLPGGLDLGLPIVFSFGRPDGAGLVLLEAATDPAAAAAHVIARLEATGYSVAHRAGDASRVTATLRHGAGALRADLLATPTPDGARVCLTFRRDR